MGGLTGNGGGGNGEIVLTITLRQPEGQRMWKGIGSPLIADWLESRRSVVLKGNREELEALEDALRTLSLEFYGVSSSDHELEIYLSNPLAGDNDVIYLEEYPQKEGRLAYLMLRLDSHGTWDIIPTTTKFGAGH